MSFKTCQSFDKNEHIIGLRSITVLKENHNLPVIFTQDKALILQMGSKIQLFFWAEFLSDEIH